MVTGFFDHWAQAVKNPSDLQYAFAKPITDMKKYLFTQTLQHADWPNTELVRVTLSAQ
jgi:hypothetical protein